MKVPVLGSNAGGVPEIITHESNGLLFETRNYNDLKDKIDMVIENSQLREKIILETLLTHCNANGIALATGASAQIDQAYDLGLIAKAVEEEYKSPGE